MDFSPPHWIVVTAEKEQMHAINGKEPPQYKIKAVIEQLDNRQEVMRKFAPNVLDARQIPEEAMDSLERVEEKLDWLVRCTDSTGRALSEIQRNVRQILEGIFE